MEEEFGKCIVPMNPSKSLPIKFYFDNLFWGLDVLFCLNQVGYDGTGEYSHIINKEDAIVKVKWVNNNVVSAAGTCYGISHRTSGLRFLRI